MMKKVAGKAWRVLQVVSWAWRVLGVWSSLLLVTEATGTSQCFFPPPWSGSYFQLGYSSPLTLTNTSITEKGTCVWNSGSQYVLKSQDLGKDCWRCLSIHRKHHNVLQYKESDCMYSSQFVSPDDLCRNIPGDGSMYSLIRTQAQATRCPIKGQFMFTYAKGGTGPPCSFPRSYADSCRDHSRLNLHYQACIDVAGSESTKEEVACIASWKEGSKGYFVGELMHMRTQTKERRYRCFIYQHFGKGMSRVLRMAESDSATCSGLWSTAEGYRVFNLQKVVGSGSRCVYPAWLSAHHTWRTLNASLSLHVNTGGRSLKMTEHRGGGGIHSASHLSCQTVVEEKEAGAVVGAERDVVKVVHYVRRGGCDSGYVCTVFSRVSDNVMSVQFGDQSLNPEEACTHLYYAETKPRHLLISEAVTARGCPLNGRYTLEAVAAGSYMPESVAGSALAQACDRPLRTIITAGCGSGHLRLETQCGRSKAAEKALNISIATSELGCLAHWTEEAGSSNAASYSGSSDSRSGTSDTISRLILSDRQSERLLCLSYTAEQDQAALSVSGCHLDGRTGGLILRQTGPCLQALTASVSAASNIEAAVYLVVILVIKCCLFKI